MSRISDGPQVWLVIPAFEVADSLPRLLEQSAQYIPAVRTIVVDDGSDDGTVLAAGRMVAQVIRHERNLGKGAALQTGLRQARANGAEWAVTLDGDLQHSPAHLPEFIAAAASGRADLALGARRRRGTPMPYDRRLSNWLSSGVVSLVAGFRIPDAQCGYRLIRLSLWEKVRAAAPRYDYETELLLEIAAMGGRIDSIPISTVYQGENSSIYRLRDTLLFARTVFRHGLRRLFRPKSFARP